MLEFLGRPGVTVEAFERQFNKLRKLAKDISAEEGSDLMLDILAHETVQRIIENRRYHWNWDANDLDFGPEDE